jgi:hypothetical protein
MIVGAKNENGGMKLAHFKHQPEHPGVMLVRRHADPTMQGNNDIIF